MKKLIIEIEDDLFAKLRSQLFARYITGNLYGLLDEFNYRVIKAIEEEVEVLPIGFSTKRKLPPTGPT